MFISPWAKAKNKAEEQQLQKRLHNLQKQENQEMRTLQNKKDLYSRKQTSLCSKYFDSEKQSITNETQFYIGTGDHLSTSTMGYIDDSAHNLIYTNKNVVDTDKLLTLHLLSVHKAESLTPTNRKITTSLRAHDNEPTETLLKRSMEPLDMSEDTLANALPFYTIEITDLGSISKHDQRLANRTLLNKKLRRLIAKALIILHESNLSKFEKLVEVAQDPESIKCMLAKDKSKRFIDSLGSHEIFGLENFILTPAFQLKPRNLNMNIPSASLEKFIRIFRTNILQSPSLILTGGSLEELSGDLRDPFTRRDISVGSWLRNNNKKYVDDYSKERINGAIKCNLSRDFIRRNIELAGKTKKIEYDSDEDPDPAYFTSHKERKNKSMPKMINF